MAEQIRIEGLDELLDKLTGLEDPKEIKAVIRAAGVDIKGKMAKYPKAGPWNQPGPYPAKWYERGYGPRFAKEGGGVGGKKTSENLGKKWTTKAVSRGYGVIIGNNVSYGPDVQGHGTQKPYHKAHGWKTERDVVNENRPRIISMIKKAIDKILAGR